MPVYGAKLQIIISQQLRCKNNQHNISKLIPTIYEKNYTALMCSYSNQDCVILAERQMYKSMEGNQEARNRSRKLCITVDF